MLSKNAISSLRSLRVILRKTPIIPAQCHIKKFERKSYVASYKNLKSSLLLLTSALCYNNVNGQDRQEYDVDLSLLSQDEKSFKNLIEVIKDSFTEASKQYRQCLMKQIEITKLASEVSEKWDDLPEYRLLADELKQELDHYITLVKTLGSVTSNESIALLLPKPEETFQLINANFHELENVIAREIEENKKYEKMLLEAKYDSILKSI